MNNDMDIRDSNPIATAVAFAAMLFILGLCVWSTLPDDVQTVSKPKQDYSQSAIEKPSRDRHDAEKWAEWFVNRK